MHSLATPEHRLAALRLTLPPPPSPIATYVTHVEEGTLLFLSSQPPRKADGTLMTGKVGSEVTIAQAYGHAELSGLNLLAVAKAALGDLGRIRRVVRLFGMVNCTPEFTEHPKVINGCSDLLLAIFGDAGLAARTAIGVNSLPGNISVEIEVVFALHANTP